MNAQSIQNMAPEQDVRSYLVWHANNMTAIVQKKVIANANITIFVEWKHDIVPTMYLYERRTKFIVLIN